MRLSIPLLAVLTATVSAQLIVPLLRGDVVSGAFGRGQSPLMDPAGPGPAIPPTDPTSDGPPPGSRNAVMLSDVMGRDRSITLFAGLVRDIESTARRLEDPKKNTTVLAPLNSAVEKLPRKPWEDPRDYGALGPNAYEGSDGHERAQRNLRRFVEAHLVAVSPWPAGQKIRPIGGDREVWWEEKDGTRLIQPDAIEIVDVAGDVANGQVWIIKGVRNYA